MLKKQGLYLTIAKFPLAEGRTVEHRIIIESAPIFHDKVRVTGVVFHAKTGQSAWIDPISLTSTGGPDENNGVYRFTIPENRAADFMAWLTTPGGGQFLSVSLKPRDLELATIYDSSHSWNFEAEVLCVSHNVLMIVHLNEKPNFTWRERSSGARMLCANYREKPKYQCT